MLPVNGSFTLGPGRGPGTMYFYITLCTVYTTQVRDFLIILQKNRSIIKQGDLNYVETFKDCIRMALIFADFKMSLKVHSHVGDNIIFLQINV